MAFQKPLPPPPLNGLYFLLSQFWYMSHFSREFFPDHPLPLNLSVFLLLFSLTASCSFPSWHLSQFVIKYLSVWLLFHVLFCSWAVTCLKAGDQTLVLSTAEVSLPAHSRCSIFNDQKKVHTYHFIYYSAGEARPGTSLIHAWVPWVLSKILAHNQCSVRTYLRK